MRPRLLLLLLWHRPAAVALIRSLEGAALRKDQKKKKKLIKPKLVMNRQLLGFCDGFGDVS